MEANSMVHPSFGTMSQLILQKERELHEMHDIRCSKLETMVEERDSLLLESSRRFEQLKDDFTYNLTLIEARDKEIERICQLLKDRDEEMKEIQSDNKKLNKQVEALRASENERDLTIAKEKVVHKVSYVFYMYIYTKKIYAFFSFINNSKY
jgi:DNA repair ATPase RecN